MADRLPRWLIFTFFERLFGLAAFVLMLSCSIPLHGCDFLKFTSTSGTPEPVSLEFGIWKYRSWSLDASRDEVFVLESCREYPDYVQFTDTSTFRAVRAFDCLAFSLGIILFAASVLAGISTTYGWMAPAYGLAAAFQALMLLAMQSGACVDNSLVEDLAQVPSSPASGVLFPNECGVSTGVRLCISAAACWAVAGLGSLLAHERRKSKEEAEAELMEALNPEALNP